MILDCEKAIKQINEKMYANEFEDAIEDLKREIPDCTIIYRKGSGSYKNLTPRPDKYTE